MTGPTDAPRPHWRWEGDVLLIELQGRPGARRDAFDRVLGGRLRVRIAAAPERGRATARLLDFLAASFDVPRAAVELRYGETSPNKGVRVHAPRRLPPEAAIGAPCGPGPLTAPRGLLPADRHGGPEFVEPAPRLR
jgi:uncharacterized protein YggU (UPF0235/DUF167 family)